MNEKTILDYLKRHGLEAIPGKTIFAEKLPTKKNWFKKLLGMEKNKPYCINFSKHELVLMPLDTKTGSLKEGVYNQIPLSEIEKIRFEKPAADNELIVDYKNTQKPAEHYFIPQEYAATPWHSKNLMHLIEQFGSEK